MNGNDPALSARARKYVLIRQDEIAGVWDTYEDALKAGYAQYGLQPFLVKQIQGIDRVHFFTRNLVTCPS